MITNLELDKGEFLKIETGISRYVDLVLMRSVADNTYFKQLAHIAIPEKQLANVIEQLQKAQKELNE